MNMKIREKHNLKLTSLDSNKELKKSHKEIAYRIIVLISAIFLTIPSVVFALTLGSTRVGSLLDDGDSNFINGSKVSTTSAVNIASMSVYIGGVDTNASKRKFQFAIYSNSGSAPGTLIASSATGTLTANSWNTLSISASLAANSVYWFVFNTNGRSTAVNNMYFNTSTLGEGVHKASSTKFGSWPSSFGTSVLTNAIYSLYATINSGPDAVAPTVSIISPSSGTTVSGVTTVIASANDNASVPSVQFQVDSINVGSLITIPPYSISWNTALLSNGSHTITAIARDAAGNQATSTPVIVTVTNADSRSITGEWSPVINWPLVAINAVLMKTGKVLVWGDAPGTSYPQVWDPAIGNLTPTPPLNEELFCAGQINLANGLVFTAGGHKAGGGEDGIASTYLYDPDNNTWTYSGSMVYDRWYPALTKLGDGRVAIISGQIVTGNWADVPELWDPVTSQTQALTFINTSQLKEEEYPVNFHLPDGKILAISPQYGPVQVLSADATSWVNVNTTPIILGSAVQYQPGKILMSGGGPVFQATSVKNAAILDMNVTNPTWQAIPAMNFGRYMHNLVVLPTGEVLAVGGSSIAYEQSNSATLPSEIWNPVTQNWTTVASLSVPRVYHSTALLLPDGRVLASGGGQNGALKDQKSAQVYSPPYLFKGTRPTITNSPNVVPYGATFFTLDTPDALNINKVTLHALGATTHSTDMEQFFTELSFIKDNGQLTVIGPQDGNQVPPGYYLLTIVDVNGVPSVSKITKIGNTASTNLSITTNDLSSGILGTQYSASLSATGGFSPYAWSISSGALPDGLSMSTSGSITGTPSATGTFNFTAQITDSNNASISRNLSIVINSSQTTSIIGLNNVGSTLDENDSNYLNGTKVTTTSGGNVVSMSVYVGNVDSAANNNFQLAIYTNSGNVPGTIVASSAIGTLTANSWNILPISAALQPNSTYWLVYNTNGRTSALNNMYYNIGTSGQGVYSNSSVNFGSMPAVFPSATLSVGIYSIYANIQ